MLLSRQKYNPVAEKEMKCNGKEDQTVIAGKTSNASKVNGEYKDE